jgi:uncharacterized membrane protein YqgA involved in biofilm formation
MIGTLINFVAVLVGSFLGNFLGSRLPERLRQTVIAGLGLFTLVLGIQMFLNTKNALVVLGSLLIGAILGEWWQIEAGLERLGAWLEKKFASNESGSSGQEKFVKGFLTSSLVFCIGPMAILGSIQDGLTGKFDLLAVKSTLDGFASLAFASTLGLGVAFAALPVLVYQGAITLLAHQLQPLMTERMIAEMTATGGVLLVGIAVSSLLELKKIRVGNFLPALVIAPLLVALLTWWGIFK